MSGRFSIPLVMGICLLQMAAYMPDAAAQRKVGEAGALFLLIHNSARINGMGGCAINVVDEQSPLYNPGALGLFHLNKVFSVSFPNTTDWLPHYAIDLKVKTFAISGGASTRLLGSGIGRHNIGIGLAYSSSRFDYGEIVQTDQYGNVIGSQYPIDKADYYSAGVGIDYYARLGIGVTKKKIETEMFGVDQAANLVAVSVDADAYDFGMILELPVADLVQQVLQADMSSSSDYQIAFTPSFAYVYSNSGDSLVFKYAQNAYPLPRMRKIGVSGYGALAYKSANIFSLRMCWERNRWEIGTPYKIYLQGGELGLMDAAFFRFGSYADIDGQVAYNTFGVGLSLHGIAEWLLLYRPEIENGILRYLATHVDFTIDYAKYSGIDSALDETAFTNLTLSF